MPRTRQIQDLTELSHLLGLPLCTKTGFAHHSPISSQHPPFCSPSCFQKLLHFTEKLEATGTRKSSLSATGLPAYLPFVHTLLSPQLQSGRRSPPTEAAPPTGPVCTEVFAKAPRSYLRKGFPTSLLPRQSLRVPQSLAQT